MVCLYEHVYRCSFFGYSTCSESWGNGSTLLFVRSKLLTSCYQTVNVDLDIPSLPPTVDTSSTRGDWVSSYKYNNFEWERPGHWVYFRDNTVSIELFLTSSQLPSGPEFLDLDTLDNGFHAHLMVMHDSDSWLHSSVAVKRFFGLWKILGVGGWMLLNLDTFCRPQRRNICVLEV